MHLGSAGTIGQFSKKNFKHILLNNGCHESVGGQKTIANNIKIKNLSFSLGYKNYYLIKNKLYINFTLNRFLNSKGPSLLEVKIEKGSLKNLIRINNLSEIKIKFMN
jgi:phosphonopyruvate decarboxylase